MPGTVSDSSTLIHLSRLGRSVLLREFFGEVLIPPAVWREVVELGSGREGSREVEEAVREGWIRIVEPDNLELVQTLRANLGSGESEAIALALVQGAELLLIDEIRGRRVARRHSLNILGFIGILIQAARVGRIGSLREELDLIRQDSRFHISENLYREALNAAGESPHLPPPNI